MKIGAVIRRMSRRTQRGPMARFARATLRRQRRNWYFNGSRPRGRGYDYARRLVPEHLVHHSAPDRTTMVIAMADLAAAIGCSVRSARREVARLEGMGVVRRIDARGGRGRGLVLEVNMYALEQRIKALKDAASRRIRVPQALAAAKPSPQLELPLDPGLSAALSSLQAKILARSGALGESKANTAASTVAPPRPAKLGHFPPHTPSNQNSDPPSAPLRGDIRSPSAITKARPDASALRDHWHGMQHLRGEEFRRAAMRHLRLACWYRGLDIAKTRRICGVFGREASKIGKESKRRYFLTDAIGWVVSRETSALSRDASSWVTLIRLTRHGISHGRPNVT
jgi:hypothetical protein